MPKIEKDQIVFEPEDRQAISEQTPGITVSGYNTLFTLALTDGDTTKYFKFLEEIKEKDPDILHAIETRTSYVTSKEWQIVNEDGEQDDTAEEIEDMLRSIPGDPLRGLMTVDELIRACLGDSYLIGMSFNEIVTDGESIRGFNHIPAHFLTFRSSVYYPRLWTRDNNFGVEFNTDKMISHYLTKGIDPARGWLGNGVAWQYVLKRTTLDARLTFQQKYGKGFLLVNMPTGRDGFEENWDTAEDLVENYSSTDGVVFEGDVEVEFEQPIQSDGEFFFVSEEQYKQDITKIILGQSSTSDAQDSNRSTADVHESVLEKRILEDCIAIEETFNKQLIDKVKALLGIGEDEQYQFKFVMSELEATLDEDMNEEGAVEDGDGYSEPVTQVEDDTNE